MDEGGYGRTLALFLHASTGRGGGWSKIVVVVVFVHVLVRCFGRWSDALCVGLSPGEARTVRTRALPQNGRVLLGVGHDCLCQKHFLVPNVQNV